MFPAQEADDSPPAERPVWRDSPAVLVIAHNRHEYLNETLHALRSVRGLAAVNIYISVDGHDDKVTALADTAVATYFAPPATKGAARWTHDRAEDAGGRRVSAHVALAQHYKWALDRVFPEDRQGHSHVIIVEDDLLLSPDALELLAASAPLLDADVSLWCVSLWNDNGGRHLAASPLLYDLRRTDFFPGLGWMMTAATWHASVAHIWPKPAAGDWDWHLRLSHGLGSMECIHPVVPRSFTIGRWGANMRAQTYDRHLSGQAWAAAPVNEVSAFITDTILRTMRNASWVEHVLKPAVERAVPFDWRTLETLGRGSLASNWRDVQSSKAQRLPAKRLLLTYSSLVEYSWLASALGLWPQPRGHSHGALILDDSQFGGQYVLADTRSCPWLPSTMQKHPPPGLALHAADAPGMSCTDVCSAVRLRCAGDAAFYWANKCDALSAHADCGTGCSLAHASHAPAYMTQEDGSETCVVTHATSRCGAHHARSRRLCPCLPRHARDSNA